MNPTWKNSQRLPQLSNMSVTGRENAILYNWIYSSKLQLDNPYTPGVENASIARVKRIMTAPKEFASRNVFYDEDTLKPV
ncbi:hypothetical protein [Salicibibacter cibarius]|uniref:hypothetical protein n=1 Tax=Salicibibacter cibarius TaxID=2743000 RepID=UPI001B7D8075|nr:hypothetical protein [Salicibibacter cibarius]